MTTTRTYAEFEAAIAEATRRLEDAMRDVRTAGKIDATPAVKARLRAEKTAARDALWLLKDECEDAHGRCPSGS